MAFISREEVYAALATLLATTPVPTEVGTGWRLVSRDLRDWSRVEPNEQPAQFLTQTAQRTSQETLALPKWWLGAMVLVYYRTDGIDDSTVLRDTLANKVIDAFDKTIQPIPGERQTLGGKAYHTYIDGQITFDNGQGDQQAVVVIPITMMVGAFGI